MSHSYSKSQKPFDPYQSSTSYAFAGSSQQWWSFCKEREQICQTPFVTSNQKILLLFHVIHLVSDLSHNMKLLTLIK